MPRRRRRNNRPCGQSHRVNRGSYYPTSKADWRCHLKLVDSRKASRPTGGFFKRGATNRYGLSHGGIIPNKLKPGPGGATYCQLDNKQMKYRGDGPIPTAGVWRTSQSWWVN